MSDRNQVKAYIRSSRFRFLSVAGMVAVIGYIMAHRQWLLYASCAIYAVAVMPVFRAMEFKNQKLELSNRRDRLYVIGVFLVVTALVVGTYLYAKHNAYP